MHKNKKKRSFKLAIRPRGTQYQDLDGEIMKCPLRSGHDLILFPVWNLFSPFIPAFEVNANKTKHPDGRETSVLHWPLTPLLDYPPENTEHTGADKPLVWNQSQQRARILAHCYHRQALRKQLISIIDFPRVYVYQVQEGAFLRVCTLKISILMRRSIERNLLLLSNCVNTYFSRYALFVYFLLCFIRSFCKCKNDWNFI